MDCVFLFDLNKIKADDQKKKKLNTVVIINQKQKCKKKGAWAGLVVENMGLVRES